MKVTQRINRILLGIAMLLGLALLIGNHVPDLPSYQVLAAGQPGAEVRQYLTENFFAMVCFICSAAMSLLVEIYGVALRRYSSQMRAESKTIMMLGVFILISGLWVLTDSRVLTVFTTEYGGMLDEKAITFLSFLCFMQLPIIFLSFLKNILKVDWLSKFGSLFVLNLSAFVVLSFFKLPKLVYFVLLMLHHGLIYALVIIGMVYCVRSYHKNQDQRKSLLFRGLIYFMSFSTLALLVFFLNYHHLYAIIYSIGFFIMVWYMIRLTVQQILSSYNQSVKAELYQSLAYTDILTNLKNRNAFITEQYQQPVTDDTACLVIDINKLKWVNDTFGHIAGDELIQAAAKIIADSFSEAGECYRIGGDEFAVVIHKTEEAAVLKMIDAMYEHIRIHNAEATVKMEMACGYAMGSKGLGGSKDSNGSTASAGEKDSFEALFHAADQHMYQEKRQSKGEMER